MTNIKTIDAATLKDWMEKDEAVLIDVREVSEYQQAHIPGSILIPVSACHPGGLPQNPDKKIVFHCKSGMRAGSACQTCMHAIRNEEAYNLKGGIEAWIAAGYPVQSA